MNYVLVIEYLPCLSVVFLLLSVSSIYIAPPSLLLAFLKVLFVIFIPLQLMQVIAAPCLDSEF